MNTWKTANAVVRRLEGGLQPLKDLDAELRVREDVGGWAW